MKKTPIALSALFLEGHFLGFHKVACNLFDKLSERFWYFTFYIIKAIISFGTRD